MPEYFKDLREDADVDKIAGVVRLIAKEIVNSDENYVSLTKAASELLNRQGISHDSVRMFVSAPPSKSARVHRTNQTLAFLYDYIRSARRELPAKALEIYNMNLNILIPNLDFDEDFSHWGATRSLALMFQSWMYLSRSEVLRFLGHVEGEYVMIRRALADERELVKSMIKISAPTREKEFANILHTHKDRYGAVRISAGSIFPVVRNIYAVLQVEQGEAVEFLALREPMQKCFGLIDGFLTSVNIERDVLSARVFLERYEGENKKKWDKIGDRFTKDHPVIMNDLNTNRSIATILSQPVSTLKPIRSDSFKE